MQCVIKAIGYKLALGGTHTLAEAALKWAPGHSLSHIDFKRRQSSWLFLRKKERRKTLCNCEYGVGYFIVLARDTGGGGGAVTHVQIEA